MSVQAVNQSTGALSPIAGGTLYADEPIGAILPFGGDTVPNGFLLCNGAAVSRTTYAALFAVIGTAFGAGDDSTTFNVPDLRESVPVGAGQNATQTIATHDTYAVGEFKDDQFQSHVHNTRLKGHMTASSGDAWCTSYDQEVTGTRTTSASTDTGFTPREGTTTHGKQLGVNYIIKATTIALPSDFEDAVDEKIAKDATYSTEEVKTNMVWIDGKPIYRKVVDLGTLPNRTSKNTPHGITNVDKFTDVRGIAIYTNSADVTVLPIPYVATQNDTADRIAMFVNSVNVHISTLAYDFTMYTGYAILEYTKTTD